MKDQDILLSQKVPPENIIELMKKNSPDCLSPAEVAVKTKSIGINKANLNTLNTILLGILAGVFIGLGAMLCTIVTTNTGLGFGLTKLIGGLVFCLGLILVVLAGAELFTGNNLLVMGWLSGKIKLGLLLRNWVLVYFANFIGALSLAALIYYSLQWGLSSNAVGANAIQIANAKVNLSFTAALTRGILCNALVCLAIWLCFSARTVVDKIMAIVFPITAFVAAGFEHSIANMYFIPIGILMAGQPSVLQAAGLTTANVANLNIMGLINNLVPVTIGNIIGGGLLVGAVYWTTYLRQDQVNIGLAVKRWLSTVVPLVGRRHSQELVVKTNESKAALREALAKSLLERRAKSEGVVTVNYTGSDALRELLARAVLAKISDDNNFFKKLARKPDEVLNDYELSVEEREALSCGNTNWLESKLGVLDDPLGTWIALRLAQTQSSN
jgi:formate/nitrite transporter